MNSFKSYLTKIILEEYKKIFAEATEKEIGHLDDVLQIPKDKLPFHNIFGNRYRLLGSFKSDDPSSPFRKFEALLNSTGWKFNPDDMGEVVKVIKTSYISKPEDGVQHRTKEEKMTIVKWMQEFLQFLNSVQELMGSWHAIMKEMSEYVKNKLEAGAPPVPVYKRTNFKKEYLEDKEYLAMFRKRLSLEKAIMKFLPEESTMQVFAGIGRVRWDRGEETADDIEDFFKISNLKKEASQQSSWLMGSKGSGKKNYETFIGTPYREYIPEIIGKIQYVVFSRHPIDVFRMSDHENMKSCHSLPSDKKEKTYDEYNICALAEAHANGMIAYALNPDEFEDPPTQELLDQYEDGELFSDDNRGVKGLVPVARLRIRNVAFLQDKGKYSEVVSRIAVPEKRTYGDNIPGFKEYVNKIFASTQKDIIQDIIEKSDNTIDFRRFLRVGGSYQDNSIESTLPDLFKLASEREDLEFEKSVQYSYDLQQSLKQKYTGRSIDDIREELQSLKKIYNGEYVNFVNLDVEEDWNGNGFYMTGNVRIIYSYDDEITYVGGDLDVQELMEEAIANVFDHYFNDHQWFRDTSTSFQSFWGGYSNVMIISFNISNFSPEDNDEYIPYDPDTWQYALSDIKDKLRSVMDLNDDDSLNNVIKEYISFKGDPSIIRTDVSERYYLSRFKDALEKDGNWNINEEEVDNDNLLGFEVVESFIAEFSGGIWLQDLFGSIKENFNPDNPELVDMAKKLSNHIATLTSMISSEGMNLLKAGLLSQQFYNNKNLYSAFSNTIKLNELKMDVQIEVDGDPDVNPEKIFQAIIDNNEYLMTIKITCSNWNALAIESIGSMMLGTFNDNNGWHIDSEKCMEALVKADLNMLRN